MVKKFIFSVEETITIPVIYSMCLTHKLTSGVDQRLQAIFQQLVMVIHPALLMIACIFLVDMKKQTIDLASMYTGKCYNNAEVLN